MIWWTLLTLPFAALALAYARAPLALWALAGAGYIGAFAALGNWPAGATYAVFALYLAAAAVFVLPPLRRALISAPVLAAYRRILPQMSQTEKEALEAGTVWWEGELFGAPRLEQAAGLPAAQADAGRAVLPRQRDRAAVRHGGRLGDHPDPSRYVA